MRASKEAQLSKGSKIYENCTISFHVYFKPFRATTSVARLYVSYEDTNKHPLSSAYGKGNHVWIATEVQLRLPLFMVEFAHHEVDDDGDDFSLLRTLLLARGDDVLKLVSDLASQKTLKSVALLTPASRDAGSAWSIDRLTAIWEAEDPATHI